MDQAEVQVTLRQPQVAGLSFDPGPHLYRFNGAVVPSVTQLLGPIEDWSFLSAEDKEFYGQRGTAVHVATALDDLGDLVEDSVHPAIQGFLASWRLLRANPDIEILSVEEQVYHPLLRVAGTLDRRARINRRHAVLDIKAGTKLASHGVQVAGYKKIWNHDRRKTEQIVDRYTVYLHEDGGAPKLVQWTDDLDDAEFTALLTHHYWSQKHGQRHSAPH